MAQDNEEFVTLEVDMELVLKDSTTVLQDGFRPGGFLKQTASFRVPKSRLNSPLLVASLDRASRDFLENNVTVVLNEPCIKPAA